MTGGGSGCGRTPSAQKKGRVPPPGRGEFDEGQLESRLVHAHLRRVTAVIEDTPYARGAGAQGIDLRPARALYKRYQDDPVRAGILLRAVSGGIWPAERRHAAGLATNPPLCKVRHTVNHAAPGVGLPCGSQGQRPGRILGGTAL